MLVVMSAHEQLEGRTVTVQDVNVTLEASQLICSVYDAVQQVKWPSSGRQLNFDPTPNPVLQSLLTYCYVVGILESNEIAAAVDSDPAVKYLCANYLPTAETIRQFRRRHVPYLKMSLAVLLRGLATGTTESYSSYALDQMDQSSPNYSFHGLAAERLSRAVRADSHALDA